MIITASIQEFQRRWKLEADAIREISFHGLDLRRVGNLRMICTILQHKIFSNHAMTNAKRNDMSYS